MSGRESENEQRNLEWLASPSRELLRLAWPVAISMISYSLKTLVDTVFVAGLGTSALAGVGLGGMAAFTLLCFGFGSLRGVKVLVSQARGAGERGVLGAYLGAGLAIGVVFGTLILGVGFLVAQLLPAISESAAAGADARTYLSIRGLDFPIVMVIVALREYRYGLGDSRGPMWASLAGNLANVGFDALFIYGLGFGVAGAAWASVLATLLSLLVLIPVQHQDGWRIRGMRLVHLRAVLRVGLPTGIQFLLEMGSFAALGALLSALSETEMAAHQVAIQIIHFTFLPILAVAEAAAVMAGEAVGARRDELVGKVSARALLVTSVYALLCTVALVLFSDDIARAFAAEGLLKDRITMLLYIAAVFQWFDAANAVARCVLRGTGDVRYPAVVGIGTAWLMTPPLTWLLGYELGLGAAGGWVGLTGEIVLCAGILWWRLGRGHWRAEARKERLRAELTAAAA